MDWIEREHGLSELSFVNEIVSIYIVIDVIIAGCTRMSERDITSLNSQLVEAVRKSADDEAERLLDLGASADVCAEDVC